MTKQNTPTYPRSLMGKVQIDQECTMREQVERYLSRMRHTLPLPCSAEECYFGLVPPAIKQWHDEGLFRAGTPKPGRASNLLATMYSTSEKQLLRTARPNILHVSVEDEEDYLESVRGNRGYERIFWFEAPLHVPLPCNSVQTPFFLPKDHPFYVAINEWVEEAFKIENELQASLELIERYSAICKTATQVENTWPELMNFITYKNSRRLSRQALHELRDRVAKVICQTDKEALILQLTRAAMLPEKKGTPLSAWVKFYTQEIVR